MKDTSLNARQEKILAYLAKNPLASRKDLSETVFADETISRITLIRDLNELIALGFVHSEGAGRNVAYSITAKYALLNPIDLNIYYVVSPDERILKHATFNFEIFNTLYDILSVSEKKLFEDGKKALAKSFSTLDPTIIKRELERFMIELSWKSSQIEGNTYTLLETEELIKNSREALGHDKSEAVMILNHKSAFDTILQHKENYENISLHDLQSIHSVLIKDLEITSGVRKHRVGITGTKYIPLDNEHQIQEALQKLFRLLNTTESVPEAALILLAMISYIQPFADGNKRTSRMISNSILLANGYYPLSYRSVNEIEFKKALLLFYEQNNLYHLKRIFLEQQAFAINNYFLS